MVYRNGRVPYLYSYDNNDIIKPEIKNNDGNIVILETMHKAHSMIEMLVKAKEYEQVASLLGGCQDLAIKVGEDIEREFGECGSDTVHLLEEYCEAIYNFSQTLQDSEPSHDVLISNIN